MRGQSQSSGKIHHALRDELPVIRPELSCTHYRLLLKVEQPAVRKFYLEKETAKIAYVAMSRPTHLLCFALHQDRLSAIKGKLDNESEVLWRALVFYGKEWNNFAMSQCLKGYTDKDAIYDSL